MILLNTTFISHNTHSTEVAEWLRDVYMPAAQSTGLFTMPLLTLVLTNVDPDATSYALQMRCENLNDATRWHDVDATALRNEIKSRWGQRVLFFTTYMEIL